MQFNPDQLLATTVHDRAGNKVGRIQQVYLDDGTGAPSWVTVRTGLFGTNESLLPLDDARLEGDVLQVPFDKQVIRDAPNYDPGHHLDESDEADLYRYYGMSAPSVAGKAPTSDRGQPAGERVEQPGASSRQGHVQGDSHDDVNPRDAGQRDAGQSSQPSGEYISGPATPDQRETDQPSGEYISGSAMRGQGEQSRASDQSGEREQSGHQRMSDSDDRDQRDEQASQGSTGPSQERDLLERERDLLQRERNLLDRERELAEPQGSGRPRLRRHDPSDRT